ncbi:MAG: hypothetical protein OEX02_21985 [Cyclobacteriaceae bacterium]|nr:hypothetical protein [Cyclobacteriaceae bacterium]
MLRHIAGSNIQTIMLAQLIDLVEAIVARGDQLPGTGSFNLSAFTFP